MVFGRNKNNGLDISSVGGKATKLSGGNVKGSTDLSFTSEPKHQRAHVSQRGGSYVHDSGGGAAQSEKRMSGKAKALIVLLVVCSLALAFAVGAFVYQMTVKNALKMDLDEEEIGELLTEVDDDAVGYWSVVVRTDASSAEQGHGMLTDVALVRVNTSKQNVSFLWIPSDTRVYLAGYGYRTVQEAFSLESVSGVIDSVESLADVNVSHYFEVNEAGLERLEEELDPLELEDDATESSEISSAVCKRLFESSSETLSTLASSIDMCVSSDVDAEELAALLEEMQGTEESETYQADAPTTAEEENGEKHTIIDSDSWMTVLTRVKHGNSPEADKKELSENKATRNSATVTIWNGVGVSGVAADCEEELTKLGWDVTETGNAAQYVYDETFIIYKDSSDRAAARLLVSDLGQGRLVQSAARYNFSTTLLVVVGADYEPY